MGRKINVAFLWHMHQPPYEDPRAGVFVLPWTYLHATKDYYDMGEVVRRHPGMRLNVNFTPSLLQMFQQYVDGSVPDQTLLVMRKDPSRLTQGDREFLLRTCFGVNHDTMIARFPRYRHLAQKFHLAADLADAAQHFRDEDYLDLTVLYLLVWCGPTLSQDPLVQQLSAKGQGFTASERDALIETGRQFIGRIVPLYRELAASGQVELSTTPFNHPILPLLISNNCAVEANPNTRLPFVRMDAPGEAERQVEEGLAQFERTFGFRPAGMWPAEGAVSEAAARLLASRGVRWIATDEEILRRSLGGESTLRERLAPHPFGDITLFFRDHFLSDQIGFVYSRWPREKSVESFLASLRERAEAADDDRALVVVALDGENCWEFYQDGGYPFLDALYGAIVDSDFARPVTFSEYLDQYGPGEPLDMLATGSWIDGNLDTWMGDIIKNRAWSMLASTYQAARDTNELPADKADRVRRNLMRAEASDWFWWFGKGHTSIHEREFDYLFRQNLKAVYEDLGLSPPDVIDHPVEAAGHALVVPVTHPTSTIHPTLTGRHDSYYKWVGAGRCTFSHGSIHRLQPVVSQVHFGFDREGLYLCVEGFQSLAEALDDGGWLRLLFQQPRDFGLVVRKGATGLEVVRLRGGRPDGHLAGAQAALGQILEMALPVAAFGKTESRFPIEFHLVLGKGDLEVERFPWDSVIAIDFDPEGLELASWCV